jgi:hypothetical protein
MKLNKLSLKDKGLFREFLGLSEHGLSAYAFANIYIWRKLFEIRWALEKNHLCVFFSDNTGAFLYLEPLAKEKSPQVIADAFALMNRLNRNPEVSRVENVEEASLDFYRGSGLECRPKPQEYLYLRAEIARLAGDKYKSQRAARNYFLRHNQFAYQPYSAKDGAACLRLFRAWQKQRSALGRGRVYDGMLEDSFKAFQVMLKHYQDLNLVGRIAKIGRQIRAFTFGFPLSARSFCVIYEVADLSFKGLAQFIFQRFCAELGAYRYINAMDDSGLDNLRRVKLSYRPVKLVPAYIAREPPHA